MERRRFMALGASCACFSLFAGCGELSENEGIDLEVKNEDSEAHSYQITGENGGTPKTSGQLDPGETDNSDNFIPYLDTQHYSTIVIFVDDNRIEKSHIWVSSTRERMFIDIHSSQSVEIRPKGIQSTPTPVS